MRRIFKVSAAALLSLIWPGLGQIWARRWRRGLLYLGLAFTLAMGVRALTRLAGDCPNAPYVKRVVALPGERVEMKNGALYINGVEARRLPMREPDHEVETLPQGRSYEIRKEQKNGLLDNAGPFEVPPGHLFVLGDNRDNSMDSRISEQDDGMGFVPIESLIGRAGVIYWSHNRDRILSAVR